MGFSTFPNNPFPPSSAQFDEGRNDFIQAEIDAIKDGTNIDSFGDVETALALKTNLSNIAPAFDATSGVYAVGDKVIYNGVLYEFTSAHSTAGEWDESEVQPVKISELIDSLKSGLMVYPVEAQKNSNYVGDNYVNIIKIGHMVNISGRFQVSTEKPSGQENYLFTVPKPVGIIIPVYNAGPEGFIISQNGYLTANGVITTGYYNVNVTYSTFE